MPDFAANFDFCIEEDAYQAFEVAMSSTTIAQTVRDCVFQQIEVWKRNKGKAFWSSQRAKDKIDISTNESVEEIIDGSGSIRRRLISERVQYHGLSSESCKSTDVLQTLNSSKNSEVGPPKCPIFEHKRESRQPKVFTRRQTTTSTTTTTPAVPAQTAARKSRLTFASPIHRTSQTTIPIPVPLATQPTTESSSSHTQATMVPTTTPSKQEENAAGLRLPEPWRSLMEMAKKLHLGQNTDIPPMSDISHLSSLRQSIFKCAYDNLSAFKSNKKLIIRQKDAHVALSLTLNLSSPEMTDYFHGDDISAAMKSYNLNITENRTSYILGPLQEILEMNDVEYLQNELVLRPSFGCDPSEADVVDEWKTVFNYLLKGSNIYMRSILDEEFDEFGRFGRKIDLTFYSDEYELANCEFKLPDAPVMDIKIQNRKNIRLNRGIMESHLEASGLKLNVLFFDYQGWNGSMFALFSYGDIYVSKYIESVELPRTKAGLRRFLRGETLELLLKFVDI
ncbi:hypothetical protein BGZ79_010917 [Entomortierella chlamydospora]|nr:hypothetical protein BGZ79_010917 [Entomortierella chlamydospora]